MKHIYLYLLLCLFSTASLADLAKTNYSPANKQDTYILELNKSSEELVVKQGSDVIRRYRAATGRGGEGSKRQVGDKKTPVGVYRIIDFKRNSRFHYFMQLDYPNLLDAWYGYKHEIIDAGEFRAITTALKNDEKPPQNTALGGFIGIHGIGETSDNKLMIHEVQNWTAGCIALKNEEINDLRQFVSIGTKVVIKE